MFNTQNKLKENLSFVPSSPTKENLDMSFQNRTFYFGEDAFDDVYSFLWELRFQTNTF